MVICADIITLEWEYAKKAGLNEVLRDFSVLHRMPIDRVVGVSGMEFYGSVCVFTVKYLDENHPKSVVKKMNQYPESKEVVRLISRSPECGEIGRFVAFLLDVEPEQVMMIDDAFITRSEYEEMKENEKSKF